METGVSMLAGLQAWLEKMGFSTQISDFIAILIVLTIVIILAFLADYLTKNVLLTSIKKIVIKSRTKWDDVLISRKVLQRISHLAPALIVYFAVQVILSDYPETASVIKSALYIYVVFIIIITLDALLSALHDIYQTLPISSERPIKGYVQVTKIIIHSVGGILIISQLLGKTPTGILASLGALAAVLVLVFRDTILGFVSSIQLSANNMVKPGDWISMPSRNADGIVIDITVNTVKVRNWDKTISTIPTYALISESFQNWKGMEESKGRRIARSIYIDIKSISFCTEAMLERFKKFRLIREYLIDKQKEIDEFNKIQGITNEDTVSRRRLTNVGTFRKYIQTYLENHPKIHPNEAPYITMVRHLQPTERGLPIQIYCFSKEVQWKDYEMVQADIFDHILAVISEFELKVYQNPSGDDFRMLGRQLQDEQSNAPTEE